MGLKGFYQKEEYVAGRTWRERFRERMNMGLPDNERQRRLSKIPGRRKQIRKKK